MDRRDLIKAYVCGAITIGVVLVLRFLVPGA